MADNVFDNHLTRNKSENLYLDSKTADVKFVFGAGTDHVETVPAHKSILSIVSPMFDKMFYGSLPEPGDVPIVDASAAAFKEFLQFFYLNKVQLTPEHIIDVSNLCKKYELVEGLAICENPLQKSFSIDEMCSGYALAILLEITNTIQFCEKKIKLNAEAILKSTSFLIAVATRSTKYFSWLHRI
ncbi:BTB/POZ domain-containing protein 3-like [Sitodiplosis mosellana]|uniref:BTB/POZ domain-containing protein 3-like n=1 Tax=Sitodiplosis mosellana TaxID=263140 RepID=UPI002444AA9F|nr:BTB/POZ domain-containing protein 3-like [Sitodiplosis mosellana]